MNNMPAIALVASGCIPIIGVILVIRGFYLVFGNNPNRKGYKLIVAGFIIFGISALTLFMVMLGTEL
jgi:hypothetical protein